MNSLSWFLYFVDVLSRANILACIVLGASAAYLSITMAIAGISAGDFGRPIKATWFPWWKRAGVSLLVSAVVFTVIPSSNTLYAIAASEVGEKVVKSEAVQGIASDATKALQQWIKRQLDEPKAEKGK